jgi:hypothetical protein
LLTRNEPGLARVRTPSAGRRQKETGSRGCLDLLPRDRTDGDHPIAGGGWFVMFPDPSPGAAARCENVLMRGMFYLRMSCPCMRSAAINTRHTALPHRSEPTGHRGCGWRSVSPPRADGAQPAPRAADHPERCSECDTAPQPTSPTRHRDLQHAGGQGRGASVRVRAPWRSQRAVRGDV